MRKFIKNNSLSIVFLLLFLICIAGQVNTGLKEYNKERTEEGLPATNMSAYLTSGHFLQATFENWESEFLQMALFIILTISLRQKGSSESKGFSGKEEVDREPNPKRKDAPGAVRYGGIVLSIYKHSLSIALLLLFLVSFRIHLHGSLKDENEQLLQMGKPTSTVSQYISDSRFWFESFHLRG